MAHRQETNIFRLTARVKAFALSLFVLNLLALSLLNAPATLLAGEEDLAPISMAGPDGQGLHLEKMNMKIALHGSLSLTEMEMVFRNPKPRQVEGKFNCTLPTGATISRFAKEVNGKLMEGEVVERKKATRVYTQILHTKRDPALLEQDQGNVFKARVFPIPANGTVRLVLSYSRVAPVTESGERRIEVPLKGLQKMKNFELLAVCRPMPGEVVELADAAGNKRPMKTRDRVVFAEERSEEDFEPKEDLVFIFRPSASAQRTTFLRAGDFQMVSVRPQVPQGRRGADERPWLFFVDTSASLAGQGDLRLKALEALLDEIKRDDKKARVKIFAFDLDVTEMKAPSWHAALKAIRARHFLGGTDMAKLCRDVSSAAKAHKHGARVVLVTDGVATFGTKDVGEVKKSLELSARDTLHMLVIGSKEDERMTRALADVGRGRVVRLPLTSSWRENAATAASSLLTPVGVTVTLYDEGAEWIEPAVFRDVRPGAELVAFSKLRGAASSQVGMTWDESVVKVGGRRVDRQLKGKTLSEAEFAPLLEREAYRARLALLERQRDDCTEAAKRKKLIDEMINISVGRRVLCPLTSLLVLETERDYERFGIDRRALKDIMVVGDRGVELKKRKAPPRPPVVKKPPRLPKKSPEKAKMMKKEAKLSMREMARTADDDDEDDDTSGYADGDPNVADVDDEMSESEAEADNVGDTPSATTGSESLVGTATSSTRGGSGGSGGGGGGGEALLGGDALDGAPPPPAATAPVAAPSEEVISEEPAQNTRGMRAPTRRFSSAVSRPRPRPVAPMVTRDVVPRRSVAPRPGSSDRERRPANQPVGRVTQRAQKKAAPAWTKDRDFKPTKIMLAKMKVAVKGAPKDRRKRNAYCWGLARCRQFDDLRNQGLDWQRYDNANPMVYEFIGDAFSGLRDEETALRAYASIAEVSPGNSGLLNRAGYLLLRGGEYEMAETMFRFAIERRPDHHNNYRGLSLALWLQGKYEEAAKELDQAMGRSYNSRYKNLKRVLREELGYVLRAWMEADRSARHRAEEMAAKHNVKIKRKDALRITLHWETDANDVDLHVVDPSNEECYYSHKNNASGLNLYEDLTQGLGPEVATVPPSRLLEGPYHIGVKYFSAGPMGVSRGIVIVQRPDGKRANIQIEPFTLLPDVAGASKDMRHIAVFEH